VVVTRRPSRGSARFDWLWIVLGVHIDSHSRLGEPYPGGVELEVPDPPLSDGVVALRVPTEQDLPAIERRIVDPDIVQWVGPYEHSARELLALNWTRWTEGTAATFSVCDPNDACLGHVWVDVANSHRGSVGYWLLPEARGKGFATRSVQLISRWALGELGMARLSVETEPSNHRSQRVAERSGFVKEGILRSYAEIGGRLVDCVVLSLVPADLGWGETR
jgi:[ribosomal protein S5]-alanine N-acetyltransferase